MMIMAFKRRQLTGLYISPDESGVELGHSGGSGFCRIKYNTADKYVDILLPIPGSALRLPRLAPIDIDGACAASTFQFGPNSIGFDPDNQPGRRQVGQEFWRG